jgi:Fe-S cluster biosynthesis and repair protein YggX
MPRIIHCVMLDQDLEGLDFAPFPDEIGQRIYDTVSKPAWQQWLAHQTMLINEYRLTPFEPKAREFLMAEMQKFLFEGGAAVPEDFVAPEPEPDAD